MHCPSILTAPKWHHRPSLAQTVQTEKSYRNLWNAIDYFSIFHFFFKYFLKYILLNKHILSTSGFFHIIKQACFTLFLSPDQINHKFKPRMSDWLVLLNSNYKLGVIKIKPVNYIFQKLWIKDCIFLVDHSTRVNWTFQGPINTAEYGLVYLQSCQTESRQLNSNSYDLDKLLLFLSFISLCVPQLLG